VPAPAEKLGETVIARKMDGSGPTKPMKVKLKVKQID
jgi:hypothetical protein